MDDLKLLMTYLEIKTQSKPMIISGDFVYYFNEEYNWIKERYVNVNLKCIPISKLTSNQRLLLLTPPVKPSDLIYKFERIWKDNYTGFKPYVDYINGKTYDEYPEDSYIKKNWRSIEYENKNYSKNLEEYYFQLKLYNEYKKIL